MRKNWKSESSFGGGFFCRYHGPAARDRLFNTLDARPRRAMLRVCYGCLLDWRLSLLPNVRPVQPIDELPARRVGGPKAPTKPPSVVPCTRIKRLAPVEHSVVVEQEQLSGSQVDRVRTRVHILKPLRELGNCTGCQRSQPERLTFIRIESQQISPRAWAHLKQRHASHRGPSVACPRANLIDRTQKQVLQSLRHIR
jgi:predicted Fe-S protein YdhL (DUF1289 family)